MSIRTYISTIPLNIQQKIYIEYYREVVLKDVLRVTSGIEYALSKERLEDWSNHPYYHYKYGRENIHWVWMYKAKPNSPVAHLDIGISKEWTLSSFTDV